MHTYTARKSTSESQAH